MPRDGDGRPDFRYVATHICDLAKRRLKESGATGIQGEFGIGLLSFWTIGETLTMTCAGADFAFLSDGDAQRRSGLLNRAEAGLGRR